MCPFICSGCFVWVLQCECTLYCPSTFSPLVNKTSFFPIVGLPVRLIFSLPHMNQLGEKNCNWNGRVVLPSSAAFSSRCLSTLLYGFSLHLHSFNLYSSASPLFPPLSVAPLLSHHLILWSLCLLSFLSPPLRLASSQRDGNPPDLPDRC